MSSGSVFFGSGFLFVVGLFHFLGLGFANLDGFAIANFTVRAGKSVQQTRSVFDAYDKRQVQIN